MSKPKFWWFQGQSVDTLTTRLANNPGCRLEVHLDGQDMTFRIVPLGEVTTEEGGGPPINDSHPCPPSCP